MERHVRQHPSVVLSTYINEPFPISWSLNINRNLSRPELEQWMAAADLVIHKNNPDRVIKPIDGDYDGPSPGLPDTHCYNTWYNGHMIPLGKMHHGYWQAIKPGWYYGCGEFGSEGLDDLELMKRAYPKAWLPQEGEDPNLWTPDRILFAQSGKMFYQFFEKPTSIEEWIQTSHDHQVWGTKIQTEAFRRDPRMITFAIHLFIDAFPSGWMKTIMTCERKAKPAYFTYRDALTPLSVQWWSDRFDFFSGETWNFEAWACNDRHHAPENTRMVYRILRQGQVYASGEQTVDTPSFDAKCLGELPLTFPSVKKMESLELELQLQDKDGNVLHENHLSIRVHPSASVSSNKTTGGLLPREQEIQAKAWVMDMGGQWCDDWTAADNILVPNAEIYHEHRDQLENLVHAGRHLIFLPLETGELSLFDSKVQINENGMNPVQFSARAPSHPWAQSCEASDFKFWYEPELGYAHPHQSHQLKLDDTWTPVLMSGQGGFGTPWNSTHAVSERLIGQGKVTLSQVDLLTRCQHNPGARKLSAYLLD